jgi:hypothetical protein
MASVVNTTSTGPGTSFGIPTSDAVAISTVRTSTAAVATSVQAQGSLDGTNWYSLGAAQTYQTTGVTVYLTTGAFLTNFVRVNVGAHTATGPISVDAAAI